MGGSSLPAAACDDAASTLLQAADVERLLARGALVDGANAAAALLLRQPDSAGACHLAAIAAVLQRQGPQAVVLASRAAALLPTDARFQLTLGRAHKLAGEFDLAVAAYRRAIGLNPQFAEAWVSLGITLKQPVACAQLKIIEQQRAFQRKFVLQTGRIDHPVRVDETHRPAGHRPGQTEGGMMRQSLAQRRAKGPPGLRQSGMVARRQDYRLAQGQHFAIGHFGKREAGIGPADIGDGYAHGHGTKFCLPDLSCMAQAVSSAARAAPERRKAQG